MSRQKVDDDLDDVRNQEEDDADESIRRRHKRLAELKAAASRCHEASRAVVRPKFGACRPRFGRLITLSQDEYVEAIDNEHPSVHVVIHLFEEVPSISSPYLPTSVSGSRDLLVN